MNDTGTNEAEQSLNTPKSEKELADQILTAVSEGNNEEMDRLFTVELTPDAEPDDTEDSDEDSSEEAEQNTDEESDGQTTATDSEEDEEASTTTHTPDPAAEKLAQLEQELHNAKAAVGRMATMQSRLAQLERQLKQQNAKPDKAVQEAEDAEKRLRDRIAKLKEIDPDTAEILETMVEQRPKASPAQEQTSAASTDGNEEEYYKLLDYHPDAGTIFKHPSWHAWKNTLTPDQLAWASSNKADHVAVALNAYKQYMQGFTTTAPQQTQEAAPVDDVVDATKQARERKLKRSADSSDTPVKKQPKFDESRFFDEAYEKIAKEAGIVY